MRLPAAAALLILLAASASSEFLAGYDAASGKIWVLCEGEGEIFASGPQMAAQRIALDAESGASFTPSSGGTYAVQCGKNALEVFVPGATEPLPMLKSAGAASAIASAAAIFALALLVLFAAERRLFSRTHFSKTVSGGMARIELRAGKEMLDLTVRDAGADGQGQPLVFHIPLLEAGREWSAEYELPLGAGGIAPASLEAIEGGRKISMRSNPVSDSGEVKFKGQGSPSAPIRRKVERSES